MYVSVDELNSTRSQTSLIATAVASKAEQEVYGITDNVTYTKAKAYLRNGTSDTKVFIKSLKSKNPDGSIDSQNHVTVKFERDATNILPRSFNFVYNDLDEEKIGEKSKALVIGVTGDTDSTYLGKNVDIEKILNSDGRHVIKIGIESDYCGFSQCEYSDGACCCDC